MNLNDSETIWLSVLYALITTILLLLISYFIRIILKKTIIKINLLKGSKIRSITIRNFELMSEDRLINLIKLILSSASVIITLSILYFYIPLVFSFFPWTEGFESLSS